MKGYVRWGTVLAGAAALLISGVVAGVAQDKLAEVKARQDFMDAQGDDFRTIQNWGKGTADQQAALAAVDDLLKRQPEIANQFPPGTSADDFPGKSKAKPDLWKNMDKVTGITGELKNVEENLRNTIEKGDAQAAAAQAGGIYRKNCNACHDEYRVPEKS
jgi:cytochrome c556